MAAKPGPLLAAAAAAGLAFVGGAVAPDSVGNSVKGAVTAAKQRLAPASASTAALAASAPAASASASASASSVGATPTAVVSVPMGSILLPTLAPGTGTYALQAGQFGSQLAAQELSASINGRGVTSTVIVTTETGTTTWAIVAIGRFGSAAEAWSQGSYYSNMLGLPPNMVPVLVPPPKPPS
jgi:hypothetical protein